MATILHIETSGHKGSVCIAVNGNLKSIVDLPEDNSHARLLTTAIESCVAQAEISLQELDAVAYSAGPGSYTGLRIGLSTAKGLCYILEKPLMAISTLQSLCNGVKTELDHSTFFLPMIDARRNDAYVAVYDNMQKICLTPQLATIDDAFRNIIGKYSRVIALGNAAFKLRPLMADNIQFAEDIDCHASYLVHEALKKFGNKEFENLTTCEPLYLQQMQKTHATS